MFVPFLLFFPSRYMVNRVFSRRALKTSRRYITARSPRSPTTFLYGKDGSEIATTRIWVSMHCGTTLFAQSAAAARTGGFYAHKNRRFIRLALGGPTHRATIARSSEIAARYRNGFSRLQSVSRATRTFFSHGKRRSDARNGSYPFRSFLLLL